jgi:hypothetical protein
VSNAEAGGSPTRASSSSPPGRAAQAWRQRAADDPEARWGWLKRHPRWEEIELRLRHRWTPRDVERWLRTQHPDAKTVSYQTLYRYLENKDEVWYVAPLVVAAELRRGVARLMVMQEHTALIEALKMRIRGALTLEASMGGLLIPEVRLNLELLGRLLGQHLKIQQQLGLAPVVPGAGHAGGFTTGGGDDGNDEHTDRDFRAFVKAMVDLPPEQFGAALVQALGPPPARTQPPETEPPRLTIEARGAVVTDARREPETRPDPVRPD